LVAAGDGERLLKFWEWLIAKDGGSMRRLLSLRHSVYLLYSSKSTMLTPEEHSLLALLAQKYDTDA
jgi:hypothetical protein